MAAPQEASLPPFFQMSDGMQIRLTAIDATTGSLVSGVVISGVSIDVDPLEGQQDTDKTANPTGAYLPA